MMIKNLIQSSRFALVMFSVLTLSACGGSDTESSSANVAQPASETTPASVLDGGEIIEQAQQQLDQFTADAENRIDDAMDQAKTVAEDMEDEAKKKAEELEAEARNQLRNFGN